MHEVQSEVQHELAVLMPAMALQMFLRYQEQHANGLRHMMHAAITSTATLDPLPSSLSAASAALVRDASAAHTVRASAAPSVKCLTASSRSQGRWSASAYCVACLW
jgi:hypothetical protein